MTPAADGGGDKQRQSQRQTYPAHCLHALAPCHIGDIGGIDSQNIVVPVVEQTASDTAHAEHGGKDEGHRHHQIIPYLIGLPPVYTRSAVQPPQTTDHQSAQHHEIPVVQQFDTEYRADIVFALKLSKHAGRGTAQGVAEIHRVGEVYDDGQAVDHHKHPTAYALVDGGLLPVQWQHEQQDIQGVGVHDTGSIKDHTTPEQAGQMAFTHTLGKVTVILQEIFYTRYAIGEIHQEDVQR